MAGWRVWEGERTERDGATAPFAIDPISNTKCVVVNLG